MRAKTSRTFLLTFLAVALIADGLAQLPTTNILTRVFEVSYSGNSGTAFTIEVDGRQYLVSASHVFPGIQDSDTISILWEKNWVCIPVHTIRPTRAQVDLVAFAPSIQLSPTYPIAIGLEGLPFGADLLYFGYPFGISNQAEYINRGFPVPAIKKASLAAIDNSDTVSVLLLLDGVVNRGFSGGPVVFKNSSTKLFQICGIIRGSITELDTIFEFRNEGSTKVRHNLPQYVYSNTGIILVQAISPIIDAIKKQPIGARVK